MNLRSIRRAVTALLALLAVFPATAVASTTAQYWEEIGGSATGPGISASGLGVVPEHRNASIVIDADGRPVVAYTDWADIVVRRWNGLEWEIIAQPGGGHLPQLVQDAAGRIYLGWMHFVPDTAAWEVFLLVRDPATGDWTEIGGSATGGGISAADGRANVNSFSLAIGPDGTPWVAYDTTPAAGADFTTAASGIALDSQQIYVKHWAGPTDGWTYVGSGRTGGGATSVPSFAFTNGDGTANFALHGALSPTLAVRGNGSPVLAFVYTSDFRNGNPPEFNGINDDIYAVTWTGGAWVPMGPAVPATAAGAGLGGPGGISNDGGWSVEGFINRLNRPYMIIARDGAPVLGWGETSDVDALRHMYVRRWNGTAWQGLGSATGELARSSAVFDISLAPGLNGPIAAWAGGGGLDSSIFVRAFDSTTGHWNEVGIGSGTGTGISGGAKRDHTPWITVDAAGVPSVAWIEAPDIESSGQTFVRTFEPHSLADLQVTTLTAPASTRTGGTIAVTNTVRNVGTQPSPGVPLTFYLSTGTTRGPGDIPLGARSVAAMGAGGTSAATTMLTLPAAVEPGTYRVLAVVDEANAAAERNESNNVGVSAAMTVALFRPELAFTTFSVPTAGATGKTLAITNTVRNSGVAPATAFTVRFYLSSDDTLDSGDTLLGARTITSLAAGASSPAVTTVTIPAQTSAPATYRVIGVVDADNQQTELDEDNNTAVSGPVGITLYRPDLMLTALTMPAAGATGRPLAITSTVRNAGPAPATAFTVRFYLSADGTLDAGDVLLGSRTLASLAGGASSTAVTTVTIPANTSAPASYRIIAVADALDQQVETDEANNTLVSSAAVEISLYRPDLMLTALTMPTTGATGRPLAITSTVRNGGLAPATAFTVRFYLSADGTLDAGDVLLGSRMLTSLAAGTSSTAVTTVTIPADTSAPASYRIIAVADALDQQVETDEANNTLVSSTVVEISLYRPDLMLTALSVPASVAAGRPLAITHTVRNAGPAPATAFTVHFYLSADATLDSGDVLLGSRTLTSLAAGANSSAVTTVTIPANTPVPSTYRIIAVVDALGQQTETQEGNNVMATSAPMTVIAYQPDLRVTALSVPAGATAGRMLTITHTVANFGPAPAGLFTVRFYLSADGTFDASDVLLGARALPSLAPGPGSSVITTVIVPAGTVVPDPYRVIAVVDAFGQQAELDEGNNITVSDPRAAGTPTASAH